MSLENPASDRLVLRIISQDDLSDVFATMNYKNTAEFVSDLAWPMTLQQAQILVNQAISGWQKGTEFLYLARTKNDDSLVGFGGFHHPESGIAEIGYWICEEYQGQGYASEIAATLIAQAFTFPVCKKVYATTALGNDGSRRVLEKNGLVFTGEKGKQLMDGTMRPSLYFERTR